MIFEITAKDNKTVKLIKSLKKKSTRQEKRLFIAEGFRIAEETLAYASDKIYCVVMTKDFYEKNSELTEKFQNACDSIYVVPDRIFSDISDTDTPQGIMVVVGMLDSEWDTDNGNEKNTVHNIVVLDGVSEPGNMGTIIRTAEALGFDGIYLMKGCTDIYGPKTVRATMGSVFRMKFKNDCCVEDIMKLKNEGFKIISTTPMGDILMENYVPTGKQAVVIGNEAHGVSSELLNLSDIRMKIRMDGFAESLNAAIAAGIVMHWLKNCRENGK